LRVLAPIDFSSCWSSLTKMFYKTLLAGWGSVFL
jgi:hypothetical protein